MRKREGEMKVLAKMRKGLQMKGRKNYKLKEGGMGCREGVILTTVPEKAKSHSLTEVSQRTEDSARGVTPSRSSIVSSPYPVASTA